MTIAIKRTFALIASVAIGALLLWTSFIPQANAQAPQCGLDIALVIDSSGSIGGDLASVQTAFKGFVDSALGPDTEMTVIDFDDDATITQDWTDVAADIKSGIDAGVSGGATDWEEAINTAAGQFPHRAGNHPDVMIFASDGNPNLPGGDPLGSAVTAANSAKAAGVFIKSIGIGDSIDGDNLKAISSDNDYIDSDFAELETDLEALADTLCEEVAAGGGDDKVVNNNTASVHNTTTANANTGDNTAGGAAGGDGGRGGDVRSNDDADDNTTGSGGSGGNAGPGGYVATGAAQAVADTLNVVNENITRIDRCACNGSDSGDDTVRNNNDAGLWNTTAAGANSGRNTAHGSRGGGGGRGGDVDAGGFPWIDPPRIILDGEFDGDADRNSTGDGGNGGDAGPGGEIHTGPADAFSGTTNRVNRNVTRILR